MAVGSNPRTVVFGDFTIDLRSKELRRNGIRLKLPGQPFAVLAMLVEHPGEVVTREELRARLWQKETFVDFDHSLNVALNKLRETLCDSAEQPRFIETVPRTGYRFIAPVNVVTLAATETAADSRARAAPVEITRELKLASALADVRQASGRRTRRYAAALALILLCSVGVYIARRASHRAAAAPPPKIMLAVLPFENLTGDPANEYFSDGLTEELITQLAELQANRLGVIARTSVMSYKHGDRNIARVGSQLGVQYILEGTLRASSVPGEPAPRSPGQKSSGRVRITAQLIDVHDQTHLWARDYDRDLGDVLTLEREVCGEVAREIQLRMTSEQGASLTGSRRVDPEAHELYLRGLFNRNKLTPEALKKSIDYFNSAIQKDPSYAEAYAGLANGYRLLMNALPPDEVLPKARTAAEKALALDPNLAQAHSLLGLIAPYPDWNWEGARKHFERALELNPNDATAHDRYAEGYLTPMGRLEESLAELHLAQQLDPLLLAISTDIGKTLFFSRRYDDAIEQLRGVLERDPTFSEAYEWLWKAYAEKRMYPQALDIIGKEKGYVPRTAYVSDLSWIRARMGDSGQARKLFAQFLELSKEEHEDPGAVAMLHIALGDKEQAFAWLEKAFAAHSNFISSLKVWPAYDPVRNDPRFINLERRAKLMR
jgi:TolB-like protein/DNA-binding winged helix-turn-helix (wHTH) protein/tetratricopeptide (TPR) repeat protein